MMEILASELTKLGFAREGDVMTRENETIRVAIDLPTGTVTVSSSSDRDVQVEGQRSARLYDDSGPTAKELKDRLKTEIHSELDERVQQRQADLQTELTDQLESQLADIRQELDQACNRATAEALKQKAAQLGQVKEITEDPHSGSLTIVVEL
jgi:hypothetical protein